MQHQPNAGGNDGTGVLETFQRNHPPTFKGKHEPDEAQVWLKEIERIFRLMDCTDAQKIRFGTHMLASEADDWWVETRQRLEGEAEEITWAVFRREFLRKYFLEDVRGKKEIEFLELKQGAMSVTEYAAKFSELAKFYPHYGGEVLNFLDASSLKMGCVQRLREPLAIRGFAIFQTW